MKVEVGVTFRRPHYTIISNAGCATASVRAARLAAPKVAGTEFEGRAFWPLDRHDWIRPISVDEDGETATLALLVKVPIGAVEAQLAEAERRLEAELQELREEEEALQAEHDGAGDEDDPGVNDELVQEAAPAAPVAA